MSIWHTRLQVQYTWHPNILKDLSSSNIHLLNRNISSGYEPGVVLNSQIFDCSTSHTTPRWIQSIRIIYLDRPRLDDSPLNMSRGSRARATAIWGSPVSYIVATCCVKILPTLGRPLSCHSSTWSDQVRPGSTWCPTRSGLVRPSVALGWRLGCHLWQYLKFIPQ